MIEVFKCPFCKFEWKLGLDSETKNLKCPDCGATIGYWKKDKLPIRKGDKVKIRKGVMVHSMKDGERKPAGRTYWITVHHILQGAHYPEKGEMVIQNPEVRWSGSGGYWNSVDINNIKYFKRDGKKFARK